MVPTHQLVSAQEAAAGRNNLLPGGARLPGGRMIWGYAGVWPRAFTKGRGWQSLEARLEFIQEAGLQCTGVGATSLDELDASAREAVFAFLDRHDLCLTLGAWG